MNLASADEALARNCRFNQRVLVHTLNPGNTLGDHTGGSLIFQDHRPYFAGDDLRRFDWRAYARTDQLLLKTYQEEISPYLELLVDTSASMAVTPAKEAALRRWTWFLTTVGLHGGYTVAIQRLGQDLDALRPDELQQLDWKFSAAHSLPAVLTKHWKGRYRSLRVVLSDFLFDTEDAERLLVTAARDATALFALQILDAEELDPPWRGAFRLVDDDNADRQEMVIGEREYTQYRERLAAHQLLLSRALRRRGGAFATLNAGATTKSLVLNTLTPAGILSLG
jgi:uncharacterized protein (DUF58 family)